MAFWRRR